MALLNALRVVGKRAQDSRIILTGAGAAGMACTNIILAEGATNVIVCDIDGALSNASTVKKEKVDGNSEDQVKAAVSDSANS